MYSCCSPLQCQQPNDKTSGQHRRAYCIQIRPSLHILPDSILVEDRDLDRAGLPGPRAINAVRGELQALVIRGVHEEARDGDDADDQRRGDGELGKFAETCVAGKDVGAKGIGDGVVVALVRGERECKGGDPDGRTREGPGLEVLLVPDASEFVGADTSCEQCGHRIRGCGEQVT